MTRRLSRIIGLVAGAAACFGVAGLACARESNAQVAASGRAGAGGRASSADDTASLARLLNTIRGVDPLLCELVTRSVDMHGSWSRWGPLADDPLYTDSAAAALITWIQHEHRDPALVARLRTAMRDRDACVRRVGASFLARVEHPSAITALLEGLGDASADTRSVAALGLGLMDSDRPVPGGAQTREPLIQRLRDDSPSVRRAAAWALGSLEERAAIPALLDLLARDPDAQVRQTAAWAIGSIHN